MGERTHILIAIPYEPARPYRWERRAEFLAARLPRANPGATFTVALHPTRRAHEPGDGRFSAHARARNALLDVWLDATHTHILWLDSDLLDYPDDLPSRLLAMGRDVIAAPAVLLDAPGEADRFYDILGFVERDGGDGFALRPPWCAQAGPVVSLESVGCCYLAPAWLYRDGARYADAPPYTEHMAVMRAARAAGVRIVADLSVRALHAWLPDYGEAPH